MRSFDDILSDICIAFDTDIETFKNRSTKRTNEHLSLVNQAFIAVVLYNCCVNTTYVAKYLKRSIASVYVAHQKATMLLKTQNQYALNFKERIKNSCEEGRKLIEQETI